MLLIGRHLGFRCKYRWDIRQIIRQDNWPLSYDRLLNNETKQMNDSTYSNKKIIHIGAWAEALWHFRLPILKKQQAVFNKLVIYCPARRYCENGKKPKNNEKHIDKLINVGFVLVCS